MKSNRRLNVLFAVLCPVILSNVLTVFVVAEKKITHRQGTISNSSASVNVFLCDLYSP